MPQLKDIFPKWAEASQKGEPEPQMPAFLTAMAISLAVIILSILITGVRHIPSFRESRVSGVSYQGAFPTPPSIRVPVNNGEKP